MVSIIAVQKNKHMSGSLKYYEYATRFDNPGREGVLTRAGEVHELAADMQHIGAVALLSEVQAANVLGEPAEVIVPNPLPSHRERRTITRLFGAGQARHERIVSTLADADESLAALQTGLDTYALTGTTKGGLEGVAPESRGIQLFRDVQDSGSLEMILSGSDIPPTLRGFKDLTARAEGRDPHDYRWGEWVKAASEAQLVNFSQWYTGRLRILADPESRSAFVESLKADYIYRVRQAMAEGWVPDDEDCIATLSSRIARADVRFYSPFGHMPDHVGGLAQGSRSGGKILLLPTVAGNQITVHELGHAFAGISMTSMREYFTRRLGERNIRENIPYIDRLFTILNEGYNEHMTVALIEGDPTTIRPAEREAKDIDLGEGGSDAYKSYRDLFGVLMAGEEAIITQTDIRDMVTSMTTGKFARFARQMSQRWGGRDVMTEMLAVVRRHDTNAQNAVNRNNPGYNDVLLVNKMIARLLGAN